MAREAVTHPSSQILGELGSTRRDPGACSTTFPRTPTTPSATSRSGSARRSRTSSTASPSCPSSAPAATRSSRPRTSARCSWRWRRTSASSSSSSPTGSTTCAPSGAAVREAAAHRAPDPGDLRAARRAPGHLADQVGARGPGVQGPRARDATASSRLSSTRGARRARRTSSGPSTCSRALKEAGIEADLRAAQAHLQHLEEDAAQGRGLRRDLRRPRHARARRRRPRLLRGAGRRPLPVAADPRASSTTTSRSPRTTCTSRSTPRSSRSTASRSRSRSGRTRCTA